MKNSISPQKQFSVPISHVYHLLLMRIFKYRSTCTYHYTILRILNFHTQNRIISYINPVSVTVLAQNIMGENIPFCQKMTRNYEFLERNFNKIFCLIVFCYEIFLSSLEAIWQEMSNSLTISPEKNYCTVLYIIFCLKVWTSLELRHIDLFN